MEVDSSAFQATLEHIFPENDVSDSLMKAPETKTLIESTTDAKIEREEATISIPHASRFLLSPTEQSHQYFNVYQNRMRQLRPGVIERINSLQKANSASLPVEERILDIKLNEHCYLIGTIFKEMPLKPNVLSEYTKEQAILLVPEHQNFVSEKDSLILEDEGGRIKLILDDPHLVSKYVTGMVVTVLGKQVDGGAFKVQSIQSPGFPPQLKTISPSKPLSSSRGNKKFVALVSDLSIGTPTFNPLYSELLSDFLTGHLGSEVEQSKLVKNICRTILVGNTFCSEEEVPNHSKLRDHTKSFSISDQAKLEAVINEVDAFLLGLAANMHVDVIPGPKDPSNFSIPQQPLNKCLLPRAAQLSSLTLTTNPYHFVVDGVEFLGHSGQLTSNIQNYITLEEGESVLDVLKSTLEWRHLAPTAPDTLSSFPFKFHDPFVLDSCPNVYFVGNQTKFDVRTVYGDDGQVCQLISVPSFTQTRTFVLVDLQTLECHPITLETWDEH